jgi:hypothetical protein
MKGIVWDDLDPGNLGLETEQLYRELEAEFARSNAALTVCKDPKEFFAKCLAERFDFAMIDLYNAAGRIVGLDYAEKLRDAARDPNGTIADPSFPIFLISREIDAASASQIARLTLVPISKESPPSLIVHAVRSNLWPQGRWIKGNNVFIIAREARKSITGTVHADGNLEALKGIAKRAGLEPVGFELGSDLGTDSLDKINRGILAARKIVALLTPDERVSATRSGGVTHLARPNVYLELGMVGAQASVLRKTLLLCGRNVLFPSDFGGRSPLGFDVSIGEIEEEVYRFLRDGEERLYL